ncbi:MAG: hypothetical protein IJZ35_08465 [Clostridia bacterium]|nr:hypothetical protein [Clostridia bacterium]
MNYLIEEYAGYLTVSIQSENKNSAYAYSCSRNGAVISSSEYSPELNMNIPLPEAGTYVITLHERTENGEIKDTNAGAFYQFDTVDVCLVGDIELKREIANAKCTEASYTQNTVFLADICNACKTKETGIFKSILNGYVLISLCKAADRNVHFPEWLKKLYYEFAAQLHSETLQSYKSAALKQFREALAEVLDDLPSLKAICFLMPSQKGSSEADRILCWFYEEVYACLKKNPNVSVKLVNSDKPASLKKAVDSAVHKFSRNEYEHKIPEFRVNVKIKDNTLTAVIDVAHNDKYRYFFYINNGDKIVERSGWLTENKISFDLTESGIYNVTGYVMCGTAKQYRYSMPVEYFAEKELNEFDEFLSNPKEKNLLVNKLEYSPSAEPYYDFLVYSSADCKCDKLQQFGNKYSLDSVLLYSGEKQHITMVTNAQQKTIDGHKVFFNGEIELNEKLYTELSGNEHLDDLYSAYGSFWMVDCSDKCIRLSRDFFSSRKIFCYKNGEAYLFSNRYHLLLLCAKQLNLPLTLNLDNIKAKLSSMSLAILEQNFSRMTDIKEIQQVTFDEDYVFDGEWYTEYNKMHDCFCPDSVYHLEEYLSLTQQASEEIYANAKAVTDDKDVRCHLVDVTGGLDSRMVYSSMTKLPALERERIRVSTLDVAVTNDLAYSIKLSNIYNMRYSDMPFETLEYSWEKANNVSRSFFIGIEHNITYTNRKRISYKDRINHGQYGEFYRNYLAHAYYNSYMDELEYDAPAYAYNVLAKYSRFAIVDYDKAYSSLHALFENEMCNVAPDSASRKFSVVYMYRHMLHFFDEYCRYFGFDKWSSLASASALKAYNLSADVFRSYKLMFDLLYKLNPIMLTLPFANTAYNQELNRIRDTLDISDNCFDGVRIDPVADKSKWLEAEKKRSELITTEVTPERQEEINKYGKTAITVFEDKAFEYYLCDVFNRLPELKDALGVAVYQAYKKMYLPASNRKALHQLYMKFSSIADILDIIES